jgi:hypothetical protein
MKKIILASVFIMAGSLIGFAQSVDKALHNGKWYANAELGSDKITLSKAAAATNIFDMELIGEVTVNYGKVANADFANSAGGQVKAGAYFVDNGYAYKINGNSLWIGFQPKEWTYNVTALKNGDLQLDLATPANNSTK